MACTNLQGFAMAGPGAGMMRSTLCTELLDCMHRTACGAFNSLDCVCGPGDPLPCVSGERPLAGACKDEALAAIESTDLVDLAERWTQQEYASGAAAGVIELCDQIFCAKECGFCERGHSCGMTGGTAGTGGMGGSGG